MKIDDTLVDKFSMISQASVVTNAGFNKRATTVSGC